MSGTSKFKEVMKMENSNELRFSVYDHKLVYEAFATSIDSVEK